MRKKTMKRRGGWLLCALAAAAIGCAESENLPKPVPDPAAAARAFRLYYRERVERLVLADQRFYNVGDVDFGVNLQKVGIRRQGDEFEIVSGPTDNNDIGLSVWTTASAYRVFGGRLLELALLRKLNGLRFFEAVSGIGGLTARMVYPGWTRTVDGVAGTVSRVRAGQTVEPPERYAPDLEEELIGAFWNGVRVTHREDPADFLFSYMPAVETGAYSVTYSFSALPDYLRSSDCCASIKRTPAGQPWAGAYWGNHNSRDNFPDLSLGLVTAMEIAADGRASPLLREAAKKVVEAGQRIGDLIVEHDAIMTVDERHLYGELTPSGQVRPDGETENEDLGTLADCQMAFLARAVSSSGLSWPLPEARAPASIEPLIVDALGQDTNCRLPEPPRVCRSLTEAFCGFAWGQMEQLTVFGNPWLDLVRAMEQGTPGSAEGVIGGFQDDFYEITLAVAALSRYAAHRRDKALRAEAQTAMAQLGALMREFADIIYARTNPDALARRVARAAILEGFAGLPDVPAADLGDLAEPEGHSRALESRLNMADTAPWPLIEDEEIRSRAEGELSKKSDTVKARYRDAYGDTPPVRRTADGYEARGVPEAEHPWRAVEVPRHLLTGGGHLLYALPLCETAPYLLDCTWARAGCVRPDLDGGGRVDEADRTLWLERAAKAAGVACREKNHWCDGADLDRTGTVDATDEAFMEAAQGCRYAPSVSP